MKNLLNNKIVEKRKIWFMVPLIILLVGFIVFMSFSITSMVKGNSVGDGINDGFNIGIDFEGGTLLKLKLGEEGAITNFDENSAKVKAIIEEVGGIKVSYIQKSDSGALASIVFKYDALDSAKNDAIVQAIDEAFGGNLQNTDDPSLTYTTIGSSASSDLIVTAVVSIIVSTILILIYVIIRFEFWSAISAVIALIHDVLMMVTLTVIFRVQINSSFIAAVITIVSYSINATIVLFDRVRENYKLVKPGSDMMQYNADICNKSIRETFTRNINTTVTTLVAITVLAIIGDMSIREFALPVIFGLVAGCYSSMVISPSVFVALKNKFGKDTKEQYKQAKAARKAAKHAEVKEIA